MSSKSEARIVAFALQLTNAPGSSSSSCPQTVFVVLVESVDGGDGDGDDGGNNKDDDGASDKVSKQEEEIGEGVLSQTTKRPPSPALAIRKPEGENRIQLTDFMCFESVPAYFGSLFDQFHRRMALSPPAVIRLVGWRGSQSTEKIGCFECQCILCSLVFIIVY